MRTNFHFCQSMERKVWENGLYSEKKNGSLCDPLTFTPLLRSYLLGWTETERRREEMREEQRGRNRSEETRWMKLKNYSFFDNTLHCLLSQNFAYSYIKCKRRCVYCGLCFVFTFITLSPVSLFSLRLFLFTLLMVTNANCFHWPWPECLPWP